MHACRAAVMAVALLAGSATGAAGEDAANLPADLPVIVSGTIEVLEELRAGDILPDMTSGADYAREPGLYEEGIIERVAIESSDPRFAGEATLTRNRRSWGDPDEASVTLGSYDLRRGDGRWFGVAFLSIPPGSEAIDFVGDEANQGMSVQIVVDWNVAPATFEGIIYPGVMPAIPIWQEFE